MPSDEDELTVWVGRESTRPGHLGSRGAFIKKGARVGKVVWVSDYGNRTTGELSKREISFHTVPRNSSGPGFDFAASTRAWACENDEIEKLVAFLHTDVAHAGRYRLVDTTSPQADLLRLVSDGLVGGELLVEALRRAGNVDGLADALARSEEGLSAASSAVISQRRRLVSTLRDSVADASATESDLHALIGDNYWLFGGQYVGVASRRSLVMLDQYDIPLLTSDGTLHVIELKGPHIPTLVRFHRNHWIAGNPVHEAVAQAMSYLRSLDEMGSVATIQFADVGEHYKLRRVMATAVIGSKQHLQQSAAEQADLALRTYNTHLSRVQVMTFDDVLDAADRALDFESQRPAPESPAGPSVDVRESAVQLPSQSSPAVDTPAASTSDSWSAQSPSDDPWAIEPAATEPDPPF